METFSMEKIEKPVSNSPFSPFYAIGPPPPPPHKIWPRGQKGQNFLFKFLIVTEYEGHVFRVATYLTHYWAIT